MSFEEYLALLATEWTSQLRGSARYLTDMMDYFGTDPLPAAIGGGTRYRVFDRIEADNSRRVIGQEGVQTHLYRSLKTFTRLGQNNKLLLLHGPNGSAKTSIIHALMAGMERYSHEKEGATYTFNWVFPHERATKSGIGLNQYDAPKDPGASYAKLTEEDTSARITCDLRDHPFLLVPVTERRPLLEKILGKARTDELWNSLPSYVARGDLCHRCRQIFEALLVTHGGDYRKVIQFVQVERFFYSRRYRKGLVTIEPQMHVDAGYQQLTMNKNMGSLPSSLQGLSLFSLGGDLIDANRGIVEYSDLLKRPIDSFKYLLIATETGAINVGASIAYLDTVMLGSTNELQLDAFKEFPDFTSFKARIDLIRVPYLMSASQEQEIYHQDVAQLAIDKHVAPHTAWVLSIWAVLTRLKKPNSINYPPNVSSIISNLTPIEKARLYDSGEMPISLGPEDRKVLRSALGKLREEYHNIPYYEGRMGASAREMKSVLFDSAQNPDFKCVTPLAVLREMEEFVKRVTEYDFLKQDVKEGYHDAVEFVNTVRNEYLGRVDREVRDSIGIYDTVQWEEFLRKYVQHVSLVLKKEKVKNQITGKMEDPDLALITEFEKIVDAPTEAGERDSFRQNIISQVGAWSLDHLREPVVYARVFPEYWAKLEKHYFESQKALLTKMHNALLLYGKGETPDPTEEGSRLAAQTVTNMKARLGYCDDCSKEVITFLMRSKYQG